MNTTNTIRIDSITAHPNTTAHDVENALAAMLERVARVHPTSASPEICGDGRTLASWRNGPEKPRGAVPESVLPPCAQCGAGISGPLYLVRAEDDAPCCSTDCVRARNRRAREAPLVALMNTVPEGLDANGWRAAVLAVNEIGGFNFAADDAGKRLTLTLRAYLGVLATGHETALAIAEDVFREDCDNVEQRSRSRQVAHPINAYRRAIAPPGPRPKAERRTRALRLVLDHGED